jgi:hypothetical protein
MNHLKTAGRIFTQLINTAVNRGDPLTEAELQAAVEDARDYDELEPVDYEDAGRGRSQWLRP